MTINVIGANHAPEFGADSLRLAVSEDARIGMAVEAPVTAEDADGDILAYSLTGEAGNARQFAIDERTGQIKLAAPAELRETVRIHSEGNGYRRRTGLLEHRRCHRRDRCRRATRRAGRAHWC